MASEYEIAKAMKVINETIRDETTTCDDCKVRRYCHRGYHANLCHGFSAEIKAWTSEQWDAHVKEAELEHMRRRELQFLQLSGNHRSHARV